MGGEQKSDRDDAVAPSPEAADVSRPDDDAAAPIEGMESAPMSMGPRGEIVLERSDSGGKPGRTHEKPGRTDEKSKRTATSARTAEPDENNHPSIAVNEEPSG